MVAKNLEENKKVPEPRKELNQQIVPEEEVKYSTNKGQTPSTQKKMSSSYNQTLLPSKVAHDQEKTLQSQGKIEN